METNEQQTLATATLGGGCFWCVEAVYKLCPGVKSILPGYSGGTAATANYDAVCSGATAHAEVVQISYDPAQVSYEEILHVFFKTHDPTTLNRQGNDHGPQYRSVIFYHDQQQRAAAERVMASAASWWKDRIVTQLEPFEAFYEAEDYHHDYYARVGDRNPYCTYVVSPKVAKMRAYLAEKGV